MRGWSCRHRLAIHHAHTLWHITSKQQIKSLGAAPNISKMWALYISQLFFLQFIDYYVRLFHNLEMNNYVNYVNPIIFNCVIWYVLCLLLLLSHYYFNYAHWKLLCQLFCSATIIFLICLVYIMLIVVIMSLSLLYQTIISIIRFDFYYWNYSFCRQLFDLIDLFRVT